MIEITVFEEVDDGMGSTVADAISAYIGDDLSVKYSNGRYIHPGTAKRKGNRKAIFQGRLQVRLNHTQERLALLRDGWHGLYSQASKDYLDGRLMRRISRLLKCAVKLKAARV